MQNLHNTESGDVQLPANIQEIGRRASNFRKLMLLFPYVHPAALHGVIVKNNFNWELILQILFAGQGARAEQFWDEVNEHRQLEQALQRHGIRLVCCNGFNEILLAPPDDTTVQQSPTVMSAAEAADQQELDVDMEDVPNTRSQSQRQQEPNCINIIIGQNPQQPPNGQENAPKTTVCEVETAETNDVIRIIIGPRNEGPGAKNTPKTIEIVRSNNVETNQSMYIIKNLRDTSESTPAEVQSVKKPKRRAVATKQPGEKKTRCRKPKLSKGRINEQNGTNSVEMENSTASYQVATSRKGKASSNTRVKSSKNTSNNNN